MSGQRRGSVFIALSRELEPPWFGYWEQEPDGPAAMLEQGPGWATPQEAIEWGKARSHRVLIRFDQEGYWWAGEGSAPEGVLGVVRPEELARWNRDL